MAEQPEQADTPCPKHSAKQISPPPPLQENPTAAAAASGIKQQQFSQIPAFSGFPTYGGGNGNGGEFQMLPIMYPALLPPPGLEHPEQTMMMNHHRGGGAGIYAIPVPPFMGPIAGLPSNTLVPLTFALPTMRPPESVPAADHGQGVQQQQQQQQQQPQHQHQHGGPQRQVVVRRFQIAFHLDLLLILKLAAVIFLFNQDGSRQRFFVLVFLALLVYLYQTGALAPLVRWLSQSMQRAAAPPRPPRPAVRPENVPGAGRQNENVALAERQPGPENENRPADEGNQALDNENAVEPGGENGGGNHWWGIVKEIQMIVFGFITSLLPGFHNID